MGTENNPSPTEGPHDSAWRELTEMVASIGAQFEELGRMMEAPKCESSKIATAESHVCEEEYPQHSITIRQKDGLELTLSVCKSCAVQILRQHAWIKHQIGYDDEGCIE